MQPHGLCPSRVESPPRPLLEIAEIFREHGPRFRQTHALTAEQRKVMWAIENCRTAVPWCTTPIEAESSLGPDSHHPIISLSDIPSAVMVLRILHPILASTLCAANPLARIAEPTIAL